MAGVWGSLSLVGMMGSGKSTVGPLLAERLGFTFVDVDAEIERQSGRTIPDLFAGEGEAGFRRWEAQVLQTLTQRPGLVLATGGGAVLDPANWRAMRAGGLVVWLQAPLDLLWQRVAGDAHRPLLAGPDARARFERLAQSRTPLYAQADVVVDASGPPHEVVEAIVAALAPWQVGETRLEVALGDRSYPVVVGVGCLDQLGRLCREQGLQGKALLVTDATVEPLYAQRALRSLAQAGLAASCAVIPAGESAKELATVTRLYEAAVEARLDRRSFVVALGGGVVGDIAGFVAATYLRGIPFVQVPTTLLAQVDASVGGKVGVNLPQGKNLVGAFHQPRLVLADVATLRSLSRRELLSGLAEVIKSGLIADAPLVHLVAERRAQLLAAHPPTLLEAVRRSVQVKAAVVAQDEREDGLRAILNFGHTFGHALETLTGYQRYTHGEAVAIGMVAAAHLSAQLGLISTAEAQWVAELIAATGLPTHTDVDPEAWLAAMSRDKKAVNGHLRFVVLEGLGRAAVRADVSPAMVRQALARVLVRAAAVGDGLAPSSAAQEAGA